MVRQRWLLTREEGHRVGDQKGTAWFLEKRIRLWLTTGNLSPSLISLTNNRDALSAADAGCGQSVPASATRQFVEQSQDQTGSSRAQRMSQRNRAAVDIRPFTIKSQFLLNREVLRRKGFIHFDQIDIGKFQPGLVERQARCRYGTDAHDLGFDSGVRPAYNPSHRFDVLRLNIIFAGDDERRRPIHNTRCVSRGDESVFAECWS